MHVERRSSDIVIRVQKQLKKPKEATFKKANSEVNRSCKKHSMMLEDDLSLTLDSHGTGLTIKVVTNCASGANVIKAKPASVCTL